jgi:iron complex outermembrane recepter protein
MLYRCAIASITLVGAFFGTARGFAADNSADSGQLEEVVVTAQKRSESLQTVPLSITSFSSVELEHRAVTDFADWGTTVPNLSFGAVGDGYANSRQIAIRGISGTNTTGFYLDEIPLPDSLDPRIIDVDRIEILRGPQGTLYGASSMGGTVRIISKQPILDEFSGDVHGGVSDTWNTDRPNEVGDGAVNIPLISGHLAARVVAFYDNEAGYFKRAFPTVPGGSEYTTIDNVAAQKTDGGTLTLLWKPIDSLSVTPRVMYQESTYNGFPYADATDTNLNPYNFVQTRSFNVPEGGSDRWTLSSIGINYRTDFGELVSSTAYFDRRIIETENQTEFFDAIFPGLPLAPSTQTEIKPLHRFVEEIRFASALNGPFQYVVGLFDEQYNGQFTVGQFPPAYVKGLGALTGYPTDMSYEQFDPSTVRNVAAYSQLSYSATSKLKFTGGLRWYELATTNAGVQSGAVIGPAIVDPPATVRNVGVTPKYEADYQLTPSDMVYTSAAKGFRPGGVFPSVSPDPAIGCPQDLAQIGITPQEARRYQPDSLWTYEVGTKTGWAENRLTVDGALFYTDWKNIQQLILLQCGFQFEANAGAAKSEGGELELHARPLPELDVNLGVGYNHAVITRASSGGAVSPQKVGDRVYQIPDWTADAGATYTVPLSGGYSFLTNLQYSYVGDSFSGNNDPLDPRIRSPYSLVDARAALSWGVYEAALVAKNITNEHADLADNRSIVAEDPGRPRVVTNQPRTIGLEFRAKF